MNQNRSPKVAVILQARMGSSRLPGKMLIEMNGKPIIDWVIERAKKIRGVDEVILATTTSEADDALAKRAVKNSIGVYRGSENDVLDRYYQAAKEARVDVVMRVTGDCPFLDPEVSGQVLTEFGKGGVDYVTNTKPPTYPDGMDTEVFSFGSLAKAWQEAKLSSEREHVTPYIWKNSAIFKIKNVVGTKDLSNLRLTLDTKEDYELLNKIAGEIARLNKSDLDSIVKIIESHRSWLAINEKIGRDEGYAKSIKEDKQHKQ